MSVRIGLSLCVASILISRFQVGHGATLPDKPPDSYENDETFLKAAHQVLLEVEVIEGELECPDTGRKYPVTEGIPNMLLHEDEIQ